MKHLVLATALLLSLNTAFAAKKSQKKMKLSRVDAKELCLTSKGASVAKKELNKCIKKAMRTGKV